MVRSFSCHKKLQFIWNISQWKGARSVSTQLLSCHVFIITARWCHGPLWTSVVATNTGVPSCLKNVFRRRRSTNVAMSGTNVALMDSSSFSPVGCRRSMSNWSFCVSSISKNNRKYQHNDSNLRTKPRRDSLRQSSTTTEMRNIPRSLLRKSLVVFGIHHCRNNSKWEHFSSVNSILSEFYGPPNFFLWRHI